MNPSWQLHSNETTTPANVPSKSCSPCSVLQEMKGDKASNPTAHGMQNVLVTVQACSWQVERNPVGGRYRIRGWEGRPGARCYFVRPCAHRQ